LPLTLMVSSKPLPQPPMFGASTATCSMAGAWRATASPSSGVRGLRARSDWSRSPTCGPW